MKLPDLFKDPVKGMLKLEAQTRCQVCFVYEATVHEEIGNAKLSFCHQCLVEVRRRLKEAFKQSEAQRPKPARRRKER